MGLKFSLFVEFFGVMKILRLTCRGFKTYRDTMSVGPFDGKLNCVVGFNGSGKSSLFQAIAFVLSPFMGGASASSVFLHEGSAGKALSGFVELELDNADKLFPADTDSVALRRSLTGANRPDEFTVNGKHVSRQEYILLLQAASLMGKGKRNNSLPFFYVEQGRISACVSDADRLELLKEACGIDVFSEKRVESIDLLAETEKNRTKIELLMKEIDDRCLELRRESAQLDEYAAVKRVRDEAEYQAVSVELAQYQEIHLKISRELREKLQLRAQLETQLEEIADREAAIVLAPVVAEDVDPLTVCMRKIETKRSELSDLQDEVKKSLLAKSEIDQLMVDMETRRTGLLESIEADKEVETVARVRVHRAQLSQSSLQAELQRLGKQVACESLIDRKDELMLLISSGERRRAQLTRDLCLLETELRELQTCTIPEQQAAVRMAEGQVSKFDTAEMDKRDQIAQLSAEVKKSTGESFTAKQTQFRIQQDLEKLEKEFRETSGSVLRSSNFNTRDLLSRSDIKGVEGLLGDFLHIPSAYRTAVESSLKSVLFNVVISDDSVADIVASKLAGGKGRVTLTAVNRLGDESAGTADLDAKLTASGLNATLVSSVVTPKSEKVAWVPRAVVKFFSRTAVVDSIDTGVEVAKRFRIDAVTIDGDLVSKDLVVKGGDTQMSRKRFGVVKNWQQSLDLKIKVQTKAAELTAISQSIKRLDEEVRSLQSQLEEITNEQVDRGAKESAKMALVDARKALTELRDREAEIGKFELVNLRDVDLPACLNEIESLHSELTDVTQRLAMGSQGDVLSESERVRLVERTVGDLEGVKSELAAAEAELATVTKRATANKSELVHFVDSRMLHLTEIMDERNLACRTMDDRLRKLADALEQLESLELPKAQALAAAITLPAANDEDNIDAADRNEVEAEMQNVESELKSLEGQQGSLEADIARVKELLRTFSVSGNLMDVTDEADSTTKLRGLRAQIIEANAELNSSKFQYINKRSVEQFERVHSERVQLAARQAELSSNHAAISNLLDNMTAKEAALVKDAFGRVKSYFERLFGRLVEGGSAELNLDLQDDVNLSGNLNVSVAFPGDESKSRLKRLQELSGGQRTMVGLCFLIALQKAQERTHSCLILDEVDAALDATYRSTIAETLYEESHRNVQILCTSFRPEFCSVATKHWLVSMVDGSTRVHAVDVSTAMSLVSDNVDEPVNDVSARE